MPPSPDVAAARRLRLGDTLQELLAIEAVELRPALDAACGLVARALGADQVDVFLHDAATDSLVALGASDAPLGARRRTRGLHRLPAAGGGLVVQVFRSGAPYRTGDADRDTAERRDVVEALGVLSALLCPLRLEGGLAGVIQAASIRRQHFSSADLDFLGSVARWVGLIARRGALVQQLAGEARRQGAAAARRLTPRQREVAILIAEGLTNEEIAERLVLVPGTVSNHVEHILRRLGVTRRVQIATWVIRHGLGPDGAADAAPAPARATSPAAEHRLRPAVAGHADPRSSAGPRSVTSSTVPSIQAGRPRASERTMPRLRNTRTAPSGRTRRAS
jgi:DNA-binding CsgD family transcriptional regulator